MVALPFALTGAGEAAVIAGTFSILNLVLNTYIARMTRASARRIGVVHETARSAQDALREVTGTERRQHRRFHENDAPEHRRYND